MFRGMLSGELTVLFDLDAGFGDGVSVALFDFPVFRAELQDVLASSIA